MPDLFNHKEFDHEMINYYSDPDSGLKAIIAIHNTNLGPAIGGCRMMAYETEADALNDVLRLSKGMTYKCAIGGIPFGGGKAVIIGDPEQNKTPALLHAMGDFVESLGGKYITSFDAGTTLDDVKTMGSRTQYVGGIKENAGNASKSTAYSVFVCLKKSVSLALNKDNLKGLNIAIQGVGNVGGRLAKLLSGSGAHILLSDINSEQAEYWAKETNATIVSTNEILSSDVDVIAPCALGAALNDQTINHIKAKIICGGANNQLAVPEIANKIHKKGIFYCPDYLANSGGIIDLHYQLNEPDDKKLKAHLNDLANKLEKIYIQSQELNINMALAADKVAEKIFNPPTPDCHQRLTTDL